MNTCSGFPAAAGSASIIQHPSPQQYFCKNLVPFPSPRSFLISSGFVAKVVLARLFGEDCGLDKGKSRILSTISSISWMSLDGVDGVSESVASSTMTTRLSALDRGLESALNFAENFCAPSTRVSDGSIGIGLSGCDVADIGTLLCLCCRTPNEGVEFRLPVTGELMTQVFVRAMARNEYVWIGYRRVEAA